MKQPVLTALRALTIVAAAALAAGCATNQPPGNPLEIQHIAELQGATKVEICKKARNWLAKSFVDSKAVVEVYDEADGTIIGKGRSRIIAAGGLASYPVGFTIRIDCRDGRYRLTMSDAKYEVDWGWGQKTEHTLRDTDSGPIATGYRQITQDLHKSMQDYLMQKQDF
jgi:hypothetical protein